MSNEKGDPYHYDPFFYNQHGTNQVGSIFPFFNDTRTICNQITPTAATQNLQGFDPSSYMSFIGCLNGSSDYNTLSRAFDMSCSSSEVISTIEEGSKKIVGGESASTNENPSTPNSSISSSSNEAAVEEDSGKSKKDKQTKEGEDGDEKSKKA